MGNFLYPKGMAGTKRIQHIIDVMNPLQGMAVSLLLLRQSHAGRNNDTLSGSYKGTPYTTIGHNVSIGWNLPVTLFRYLQEGFHHLNHARLDGGKNILYVYGEINIENFPFVLYARKIGYRIIFDVVEDFYYIGKNSHLLSRFKYQTSRWLSKYMKHLADGVIVISAHLCKKFEESLAGRVPVHLLPISVDLENHPHVKTGMDNPVRILYAGSFGDKDAVENLIEAFEVICLKHENTELVLTGLGTENRMAAIMNRISRSSYSRRIHYLGFLDDEDYYQVIGNCDIPCMIRDSSGYANAGFPYKLGEYLATGNPTVASNVGDIGMYLSDHSTAFLVEPGSVPALTRALCYILDHQDEALVVGRAGRDVAEKHFDKRHLGKELLRFLNSI
jgi:glycosyltransferase involved in cell wall biosynthesis